MYYIHPELRKGDSYSGTGKGAKPLQREHQGSTGEHWGAVKEERSWLLREPNLAANDSAAGREVMSDCLCGMIWFFFEGIFLTAPAIYPAWNPTASRLLATSCANEMLFDKG